MTERCWMLLITGLTITGMLAVQALATVEAQSIETPPWLTPEGTEQVRLTWPESGAEFRSDQRMSDWLVSNNAEAVQLLKTCLAQEQADWLWEHSAKPDETEELDLLRRAKAAAEAAGVETDSQAILELESRIETKELALQPVEEEPIEEPAEKEQQ